MVTIVVGGGLAGLVSSLVAAEKGKVILIDKEKIGGNSIKATSGINGCMTSWQSESDRKDEFCRDILNSGGGKSNKGLVKVLVENSGDAIRWLETQGVNFSSTVKLGGHSCARTHRAADPKTNKMVPIGFHIVSTLSKKAKEHPNITIQEKSKVVSLTCLDGRVCGVTVQNDSGDRKAIRGHKVILTTGGFSYHHQPGSYLEKYAPQLKNLSTTNSAHAVGDGIRLGETVGAELVDMGEVQLHPTGLVDIGDTDNKVKFLGPEALRGLGGILLNQSGLRFTDELERRDKVVADMKNNCEKLFNDRDHIAYLVLDETVADKFGQDSIKFYAMKKLMHQKEDAQHIAEMIGNVSITDTVERELSKANLKAPFYVAYVTPVIHYTMGGLRINENANVIRKDGKPIRGLYAVGEVTGGVHGKNRLAGNSLLECVVFGRIAGKI